MAGKILSVSRDNTSRSRFRRFVVRVTPIGVLAMLAALLGFAPVVVDAQVATQFEDQCWFVADGSNGTANDWLSEYDLVTDTETPAGSGTGTQFIEAIAFHYPSCLLYTSPSPRDGLLSRMPSSA